MDKCFVACIYPSPGAAIFECGAFLYGFWRVGLLRIFKKCEGSAKGDAKRGAKEVS